MEAVEQGVDGHGGVQGAPHGITIGPVPGSPGWKTRTVLGGVALFPLMGALILILLLAIPVLYRAAVGYRPRGGGSSSTWG